MPSSFGLAIGTKLNRLALNRFGLHVTRADKSPDVTRKALIRQAKIEEVLDIGAHVGDYGLDLRSSGFKGRIVSIEPNPEPFKVLSDRVKSDGRWTAIAAAVADKPGRMDLYISSNVVSSSLLQMNDLHVQAAPESAPVGTLAVDVITVDSLIASQKLFRPLLVKLDVQGAERLVLEGGKELFRSEGPVQAIETELSVQRLYDGQVLHLELLEILSAYGFRLWALNPGLVSKKGELLQYDAQLIRHGD